MRGRGMVFGLVVAVAVAGATAGARAAPPAAPTETGAELAAVLPRVAAHAARFEEMKRRGTFTLRGRMEELGGDGKASGTKEIVLRSVATPSERRTEILRYTEDGADKTAEARQKAEKRRAEAKKDAKRDLHLPFLASEQPRYVFSVVERDAATGRVRVAFTPREPAEDAFKGSAWIDEASGEVLTMGFSPSKTAMFVDHVDVTMRFDLATPLGRAPSAIAFEARGGLLFFRKRVRGSGVLSDPALGF